MIFWKHIKGLVEDENVNSYWTYIQFKNGTNPTLAFGLPNSNSTNILLSTEMPNGYVDHDFTFKSNNSCNGISYWTKITSNVTSNIGSIGYDGTNFLIQSINNTPLKILSTNNIILQSDSNSTIQLKNSNDSILASFSNSLISFTKNVEIGGYAQAVYFNATSDYRAKKDFKALDIDAIKLIKNTPLYSFKYKDSEQSSIGIIAQDVQDININGFELVDNKNATGENFDYMSIHESKLIYILWKAIQEQQKEIEELKALLK